MRNLNITLVLAVSILLCFQIGKSSRLLHDETKTLSEKGIFVNSLEKGPVPPSGPSGCTNIPGSGGSGCPIKEMHFAGGARPHRGGRSPTSHPPSMASFGVAAALEK
ncbi:transmembrane protein [Perilla frutescens var. frutescens]|nr:transmembrane protein [Perilla frutescens var. frutescens]